MKSVLGKSAGNSVAGTDGKIGGAVGKSCGAVNHTDECAGLLSGLTYYGASGGIAVLHNEGTGLITNVNACLIADIRNVVQNIAILNVNVVKHYGATAVCKCNDYACAIVTLGISGGIDIEVIDYKIADIESGVGVCIEHTVMLHTVVAGMSGLTVGNGVAVTNDGKGLAVCGTDGTESSTLKIDICAEDVSTLKRLACKCKKVSSGGDVVVLDSAVCAAVIAVDEDVLGLKVDALLLYVANGAVSVEVEVYVGILSCGNGGNGGCACSNVLNVGVDEGYGALGVETVSRNHLPRRS